MDIMKVPLQNKVIGSREYLVIESQDGAITAFFRDGKVYSVCIKAPFSGHVNGVHIEDSKEKVIQVLSEPVRIWEIDEDKEAWFFNTRSFLRVDFNPKLDNRVGMIYV
jgi:hypothetical protein